VQRYNSDLANGLGNLASRTLTMIEKYFEGSIPDPSDATKFAEDDEQLDRDIRLRAEALTRDASPQGVPYRLEEFDFSRGLEAIWSFISAVDAYLTSTRPWALADDPTRRGRLGRVLYTAAESLRFIAPLAYPVLPETTGKLWNWLGQSVPIGAQDPTQLKWGESKPGAKIGKPQTLFPRIEKTEAIERMEAMEKEAQNAPSPAAATTPAAALAATGTAAAAAPAVPEKIGIEDFAKVEMRVGQIKTAERIVGADKLLKLTVDIGTEIRQICAGIAQFYEPEKLVGRKVAVVVNLLPRKLRGVESNGMIVAASVGPEGRPVLAGFPDEDVEIGARLK
jgi:methionyl-tRNA synthetase